MKKIILRTNFYDYYDSWFDVQIDPKEDVFILERFNNKGMNRIEMFEFLRDKGYDTPEYGTPETLKSNFLKNFNFIDFKDSNVDKILDFYDVVVYTDINNHCGEGKIKTSLFHALEHYPNNYCSVFLYNCYSHHNGYSIRLLNVGTKSFLIEYKSFDDWRSNCGSVVIKLLGIQDRSQNNKIDLPLYAIDFVPTSYGFFAVDFNTAPQIKGTGIENIYKPQEMTQFIKDFINRKGDLDEG
jgi:hypothetical protein